MNTEDVHTVCVVFSMIFWSAGIICHENMRTNINCLYKLQGYIHTCKSDPSFDWSGKCYTNHKIRGLFRVNDLKLEAKEFWRFLDTVFKQRLQRRLSS